MPRIFLIALFLGALALVVGIQLNDTDADRVGIQAALTEIGQFDRPVYATAPVSSDELYVVEQGGRIWRVDGERRELWGNVGEQVIADGEQGLLSMAFPPRWRPGMDVYLYYTATDASQRVVAYQTVRTTDGSSELGEPKRTILRMGDREPNHNGGLLLFDEIGNLYVGTGDGGGRGDQHGRRGNGQNPRSLLGKLLRITPTPDERRPYRIPIDNPSGPRREVWATGLRNPWRYTISGDWLAVADVGQDRWEELNIVPRRGKGVNFGWRAREGRHPFTGEPAPGAVDPRLEYSHDDGWCSITGGVVPETGPYRGQLLFGDFCRGEIRAVSLSTGRSRSTGLSVEGLSSFGLDGRGNPYVMSITGPVYRIVARTDRPGRELHQ